MCWYCFASFGFVIPFTALRLHGSSLVPGTVVLYLNRSRNFWPTPVPASGVHRVSEGNCWALKNSEKRDKSLGRGSRCGIDYADRDWRTSVAERAMSWARAVPRKTRPHDATGFRISSTFVGRRRRLFRESGTLEKQYVAPCRGLDHTVRCLLRVLRDRRAERNLCAGESQLTLTLPLEKSWKIRTEYEAVPVDPTSN